ncbi:MAG: hypothetical protein GY791_02500 [Alphaproteobacteria bacterium]|nr:hypothetical protein [Alphaproteobacteria bacterium]
MAANVGRPRARTATASVQAGSGGIAVNSRDAIAVRPGFFYLSDHKINILRDKTVALLAEHGIAINHESAVQKLAAAGARVDADDIRVRLPSELVEEALRETPRQATLFSKSDDDTLVLPRTDGTFHLRTGTGAHGFMDPETGTYRKLVLDDAREIARLGDGLPEVGFIAHPFVNDVPTSTADIHGFAAITSHSVKHNLIQPYSADNIEYLMRIAAAAAGGEAALRERPVASCIVTSFTPLEIKRMDVEAIIQSARFGLPIHACSLPTAGGTAPVTVPGTVLMAATEIVAMVTMAHVLGPGTPVIATPLMFALDMRTGRGLQSSIEAVQAATIAVQLLKRGFGLMTHSYGFGSDTPNADAQSQAERTLLGSMVSLAGADILGGAGQLECATALSPVQLVIDNELAGMLRQFLHTPDITDETVAWDDLLKVDVGAHFLAEAHTLTHCREHFAPEAFARLGRDAYEESSQRDMLTNARDICRQLLSRDPPQDLLDDAALAEITRIVTAADQRVLG